MSNDRINKLAEKLEAVQHDAEFLQAVLKKAKISDLLVLHFLNMGNSGAAISPITKAIEETLMDHFADGGSYLTRLAS
jgi:hypothetical protein